MKKILIVCGMGLGSSLMMKMKVDEVLKQNGIEADVDHCDISTANSEKADFYIGSKDIISNLTPKEGIIIGLNNILDANELQSFVDKYLK